MVYSWAGRERKKVFFPSPAAIPDLINPLFSFLLLPSPPRGTVPVFMNANASWVKSRSEDAVQGG